MKKEILQKVADELNVPVNEVKAIIKLQNKVLKQEFEEKNNLIRIPYIGKFIHYEKSKRNSED